jgi:hypothetical protein
MVIHFAEAAHVATMAPRGILLLFNNSVSTTNKTQHLTITKIIWLTLFKEIIAVYIENHTKHKKIQTYRLWSRWDRYLPLGFKVLITLLVIYKHCDILIYIKYSRAPIICVNWGKQGPW